MFERAVTAITEAEKHNKHESETLTVLGSNVLALLALAEDSDLGHFRCFWKLSV